MKKFIPYFTGEFKPNSSQMVLKENFVNQINEGLFPMAPQSRNHYKVIGNSEKRLHFKSTSLLTGINIGLNDVELLLDPDSNIITYKVYYWQWAKYCFSLSLALIFILGLVMVSPLKVLMFQGENPSPLIISSMVLFWGLISPCILVVFHKKSAKKCLQNLLTRIDKKT